MHSLNQLSNDEWMRQWHWPRYANQQLAVSFIHHCSNDCDLVSNFLLPFHINCNELTISFLAWTKSKSFRHFAVWVIVSNYRALSLLKTEFPFLFFFRYDFFSVIFGIVFFIFFSHETQNKKESKQINEKIQVYAN